MPEDTVEVRCIKSPQFRVVHVYGASGYFVKGKDIISCAVFTERAETPDHFVHKRTDEGKIGEGYPAQVDVIREFEVQLVMTRAVAEQVVDNIKASIDEYDK